MIYSFNRFLLLISSLFTFIGLSTSVYGQIVSIEGRDPSKEIIVSVEKASTADVLRKIGEIFKIDIQGLEEESSEEEFTATFRGDLDKVLLHILRNRNHLIIRMSESKSGIGRIVLLKGGQGAESSSGSSNSLIPRQLPIITKDPE